MSPIPEEEEEMATAKTTTTEKVEKPDKTSAAYWNEKVTIHLFKDSGKYKDAVTVGVNGKFWQIERGVDVEVPRNVAEVLRQSQEQDQRTAEMIESEARDFESARAALI